MQAGNKPFLSILMTSYNREKYIGEAIQSVLNSSYQQWELIIVDDKSNDQTVEIAQAFSLQDNRIKVYVNERNLGDYPNRNHSASYAKGKYLKYLDADDIIYPHSLEIMVEAMENFPEAGFGLSYNNIDPDQPFPFMLRSEEAVRFHFFKKNIFYIGPSASIIRKSAFEELSGFTERRGYGDVLTWLKFAFSVPVVLFQPSMVWWRRHEEQEYSLYQQDIKFVENHYVKKSVLGDFKNPLSRREKEILLKRNNRLLMRKFFGSVVKMRFSLLKEEIEELKKQKGEY